MTHEVEFRAGDVVSIRSRIWRGVVWRGVVMIGNVRNAHPTATVLCVSGLDGEAPVWAPAYRLTLARRDSHPPKPRRIGAIMEHGPCV